MIDLRSLRPVLASLPTKSPAYRSLVALMRTALGPGTGLPRMFYLPPEVRNVPPTQPPGTDVQYWSYTNSAGMPALILFVGNQSKPALNVYYRQEAARDRDIERYVASSRQKLQRKQDVKQQKKEWKHPIKVGDIFYSSWGYDQTNVNYYQVVAVVGATVTLREIGLKVVKGDEEGHSERVAPLPGSFVGPPMRKTPQMGAGGYPIMKVDGHGLTSWTPGTTQYRTGPYGGH